MDAGSSPRRTLGTRRPNPIDTRFSFCPPCPPWWRATDSYKKRERENSPALSIFPNSLRLPGHADTEPRDARGRDRLNLIRVGRVLRHTNRLNDVVVRAVEEVDRRDQA